MNEMQTLTDSQPDLAPVVVKPNGGSSPIPPPDAKQLRTEHVGRLLDTAYQGASLIKLKHDEIKKLCADFPDSDVEIRPHDGLIYLPHMLLRERLWSVFGPGQVAEICRERMVRTDSNEIAVDLVLMIRGKFAAEAIGTAKYYPNNPKGSFGDTVESAWSDALRRCCKRLSIGTQTWRPAYAREWVAKNAVQFQGKWTRKSTESESLQGMPKRKSREYHLRTDRPAPDEKVNEILSRPAVDDPDVPF